jgi:sugar (pentulose or hexulose) kinase
VGGGAKNSLLNHFTANALQIPVVIGPSEATSAGNVLVQAIAMGHIKSLEEARAIVRDSYRCETIRPQNVNWEKPIERMEQFLNAG